jgi:hypothetical protein
LAGRAHLPKHIAAPLHDYLCARRAVEQMNEMKAGKLVPLHLAHSIDECAKRGRIKSFQ